MKTLFTVFAALGGVALSALTSRAALLSGPITNPANGHTYYLLTSATWTASETEAVGLGGHLVTINDATENSWVYSTFGSFGGVGRGLWIGLTDRTTEGMFTWVSGETSTYRNWAPGEPNNANNEDYVHIKAPFDDFPARWNDYSNLTGPFGVVEVLPPPRLFWRPLAEEKIQFSWTTNALGYGLEYSDRLSAGVWIPVTDAVSVLERNYVAVVDTSGVQRFFRLRKP